VAVRLGFKTSPQGAEWRVFDEMWAAGGELPVFESAWLNDHLTDMNAERPGPSLEAITLLATLVHHVPGKEVGHGVLSNTFRHPAVLAKAATVLDQATGGRFLLGLGAGWFEGEHGPFGIALPPIRERIDRLESAVGVLHALFGPDAASPPGVTRPDPFYPLDGATNIPPPVRKGGPPIILGGQKPRGIALAARAADGWILPGNVEGNVAYLTARRDELLRAMDEVGRSPEGFRFIGQVHLSPDESSFARAIELGRAFGAAGATDVIIGVPPALGPDGVRRAAREVAEPLREGIG
jgi:alkanesulfonate monooxygenase SsuD/methylene tetrahydromethanopterin reductase-like flavin-dependent oxidoreductase (luciferase family)